MSEVERRINIRNSIRKRPAMFIGNDGMYDLIYKFLGDTVSFLKSDFLFITIQIIGNSKYEIEIKSKNNLQKLNQYYLNKVKKSERNFYLLTPIILKAVSKKYECTEHANKNKIVDKVNLFFEIDNKIVIKSNVEFQKFSSVLLQFAILNRNIEILIKDTRYKYLLQNYFHFKEGIFYIFDQLKETVLKEGKFEVTFDKQLNNIHYQFGINFRDDWYPNPAVISYVNNELTTYGGSHVVGILKGLVLAFKKYVRNNNLNSCKIKQSKFLNGLIIVCSVRTDYEPTYLGSFKEKLDDKNIGNQIKKITSEVVYDYIISNKDIMDGFMFRFDENHISSVMY